MKTKQAETDNHPNEHGRRFGISWLIVVLALPLLLYYGYCWGWWGRHSLLLQYLFQCNCPAASMDSRYPKEVEVILPACPKTGVILSPGGRLLHVREQKKEQVSTYVFDLQTREKIPLALPETSSFSFLTDNLLYFSVSYLEEMYIWDRTTGEQFPVHRFRALYPNAEENGHTNLGLLTEAIQHASQVFLLEQDRTVVALGPDFPDDASHSFLTGFFDIPGSEIDRVEQFLRSNNIVYQTIPPYAPEEVLSPDARFVARPDGIYLATTGQKIVEGYSASNSIRGHSGKYFFARGWTDNGQAVIYSESLNPCLIETTFFIFDDYACLFEVPQPVIKLRVPQDLLLPSQYP